MKIIEGKQAVLRSYRTEADCVQPQKGQSVQPLEPVTCLVTEPSTAKSITLERSGISMQTPVKLSPQIVSDMEMQKPVEYKSGSIPDAEVQKPVGCVPRRISDFGVQEPVGCVPRGISDFGVQKPMECIVQNISDSVGETSCIEIQAPVECIPQKVSERSLQPARAQVIPASPEWGQVLEETISGRKKRKWLAETILHMTDSQ